MKCPSCGTSVINPISRAGGRVKVRKGFAVKPVSAESRRRAWKTRKAKK